MADKLEIINSCLLLKGQNICNSAEDGSQEWNICSAAYEHGVGHLIQEHDWKFATVIEAAERVGDATDRQFEDAYQIPTDALHVMWVRLAVDEDTQPYQVAYRIIGNQIEITDNDYLVMVKYVERPGPEGFPPMFISALNELIYAAIESGLKKDARESRAHQAAADVFLQKARTRTDQQEPKRALFNPRLRLARLRRRG